MGRYGTGQGTLGEVWNRLGRCGTGKGTLGEVRDGLGDPQ